MSNTPVLQLKKKSFKYSLGCPSINMANIYIVFKLLAGATQYIDIQWHSGFGNRILHVLHLISTARECTSTARYTSTEVFLVGKVM
jgi:hypothetical protein